MTYFMTAPQLATYREQTHKPIVGVSPTQVCPCCRKQRSKAQYWNKDKLPVYKFCGVCRKAIKLAKALRKAALS